MATYGRIRSTRLLVLMLLLASLMTITLDSRGGESGPLAAAGRLLGGIIGPLQEGVSAVFRPVGSFFSNVFRAGSLAERVDALERENAGLKEEVQSSATDRAQLDEYRRILGIEEDAHLDVIGTSVIGESESNFEWAVYVDKGADDGVTVDMPVIGPSGLVGRVVDVFATASKVMLIIDPDSKVSARLSSTRETALIEGQRDELLRFNLVAPETEIIPGELVETSGYQLDEGYRGIYPPGIPIGVVDQVELADDGVSVRVLVRPNVDFGSLDELALVTGVPNLAQEIQG